MYKPGDPLSPEALQQLETLRHRPDSEIDFSDIPKTTDAQWQHAIRLRSLVRSGTSQSQPLVRRTLTLLQPPANASVDVEIGPLKDEGADYSCHVRIAAPDKELNFDIHGVDGVQALQLALRFTGSELDRIGGDRWLYHQERGHGFDRLNELKSA
ncbi:hypothetical protein SAMN05421819_3764 [Bryocella elongata]|uniref:DUF6968 domain-containing protein n=2 Tax=Bryocella elongata TaxID=863522 RepID=A0A1H6BJU9_9BACT|nr:hypothetical protein SAMN05421819_3764 [Bryocella elongata]